MKNSLQQLQKAIIGEIGMSTELEELAQSLFVGGIPFVWRKLAPHTQKSLANWLVRKKRESKKKTYPFLFGEIAALPSALRPIYKLDQS